MSKINFDYLNCSWVLDYGLENESYNTILSKLHKDIKWIYLEVGDYQGNWFAIGKKNNTFYFHQGEYGSCSGCDWLYGLTTIEDAKVFLDYMNKYEEYNISKKEFINKIKSKADGLWDDAKKCILKLVEKAEDEF